MPVNICFATDNNYVKYCSVSIVSILLNSEKEDELSFYILCDNVSEENKKAIFDLRKYKNCNIFFVDINIDEFNDFKDLATYPGITVATYFRLKIANLLQEVDKLIYLDCDTIVRSSLKNLFEMDIEDYYVAGVSDVNSGSFISMHKCNGINMPIYINAGIVLLNLQKWRLNNADKMISDCMKINKDKIRFGDQDLINITFSGLIKELPSKYNVHGENILYRNDYTRNPVIVHHVCKAWTYGNLTYYRKDYFKYLQYTNWKITTLSEKIHWYFLSDIVALIRLLKKDPLFFTKIYFWYGIYRKLFRRYIHFFIGDRKVCVKSV